MNESKEEGRRSVSLSMSCPPEMERAVNERSLELGLNRSEYVRKLVLEEMTFNPLIFSNTRDLKDRGFGMNKEKKSDRFAGFEFWECERISDALLQLAKRELLPKVVTVDDGFFKEFMETIRLAQEAQGSCVEEEP